MASKTQICNMALIRIGEDRISSLTENSDAARVCSELWDANRDAVLQDAPWKCATKRSSLSRLADTPAFDYDYYYQLPNDYIRMIEVYGDPQYSEEGHKLACSEESVYIKFVYRLEETGRYHPMLVEAIATRLSSLLATRLAGDKSMARDRYAEYMDTLGKAALNNAFEVEDAQAEREDSWISSRS